MGEVKARQFCFEIYWPLLSYNIIYANIFGKVNSVQEACATCFAVHILKFEILQITWKNETKNIRLLVFSFSIITLVFWCFLFHFFMWFGRFQILICEPESIWRKFLVLSWLYLRHLKIVVLFLCNKLRVENQDSEETYLRRKRRKTIPNQALQKKLEKKLFVCYSMVARS